MAARNPTIAQLEREKLLAEIAANEAAAKESNVHASQIDFEIRRAEKMAHEADSSATRNNIYTFNSEVNYYSVADCMSAVGMFVRRDPTKTITVVFNSPGGSVIDGLGLYDYFVQLREKGVHLEAVTLGMAASMGGILLQGAGHRVMSRNSYLLIHEVSGVAWGKQSEAEEQMKFQKRLQDRLVGILAERSNFTKEQIKRRWKKTDWWLDAEDALAGGFIDEVR